MSIQVLGGIGVAKKVFRTGIKKRVEICLKNKILPPKKLTLKKYKF